MPTPWLTSLETVEVLELLEEISISLRNTAKYATMRKELREGLEGQARECEDFVLRIRKSPFYIDEEVLLAIDALAYKKKRTPGEIIQDAIEAYISAVNRRA